MKAWLLLPVLAALAFPAAAAPLKLGKASYGGPGCPGGSAAVASTNAGITIRFSSYQVAAGGSTGKSFDRKACGLSIPITVPKGKSVALVGIDFTGYNRLPSGASAQFKVEEFFPGSRGPVLDKTYKGAKTGKFSVSADSALAWSACGASGVTFRVNTSLIVRTTGGKAASASIRSQDVNSAIVYRLRFKDC